LWVIGPHEIKGLKILQNSPLLGRARFKPEISRTEKHHFQSCFSYNHLSSTKYNVLDGQPKDLGLFPGTGKIFVKPPIIPDWIWKPRSLLFKKQWQLSLQRYRGRDMMLSTDRHLMFSFRITPLSPVSSWRTHEKNYQS